MQEQMIEYLEEMMTKVKAEEAHYKESNSERDKRRYERDIDRMLACKDMVEAIIGQPVNCRLDGTVTIGF